MSCFSSLIKDNYLLSFIEVMCIMGFKLPLKNADSLLNSCIDSLDIVLVAHVVGPRGYDNILQRNCSETEQFTVQEFNEIYRGVVDAGFYMRKVFFSEIDFIKDFIGNLEEYSSTVVFNLCRNGTGMNKKAVVPAICDLLGTVFTSSDSGSCALARNKSLYTTFLSASGISCPISGIYSEELSNKIANNTKVICKPVDGSASQGISYKNIISFGEALALYDESVLIQEYIDGYECEVPIFCSDGKCFAMPPVGISFEEESLIGILTYESSMNSNYGFYNLNDILPSKICEKIMKDAEKSFDLLGLETYGRIDFRIDRNTHQHYLMDVSTTPYITKHSSFAFAMKEAKRDYSEIFRLIISAALQSRRIN